MPILPSDSAETFSAKTFAIVSSHRSSKCHLASTRTSTSMFWGLASALRKNTVLRNRLINRGLALTVLALKSRGASLSAKPIRPNTSVFSLGARVSRNVRSTDLPAQVSRNRASTLTFAFSKFAASNWPLRRARTKNSSTVYALVSFGTKPRYSKRNLNQLVEVVGCDVIVQTGARKMHANGTTDEHIICSYDECTSTQEQQ